MATYTEASIQQGTYEIRKWTVDFTNDLPSAVTVSSGTAYHTPPSGSAGSVTVTTSSPYVYAQIGTLAVTGVHYLDVVATLSDGEKSQVRVTFIVNYPSATARAGMADIVDTLRSMTDAGVNDYTIAGVPYWSDAQVQKVLDRHRNDFRFVAAQAVPEYPGSGSVWYREYRLPFVNIESGTLFELEDATGSAIGTSIYSVDYARGVVTFTSDTTGSAYYASGRAYDLYGAAADLWRLKAANASKKFDFSTDNHSVKRSQEKQNCLEMAQYYEGFAAPTQIMIYREDCRP